MKSYWQMSFKTTVDDIGQSDSKRVNCVLLCSRFVKMIVALARPCLYHSECFANLLYWFEDVSLLLHRVKQDSQVSLVPRDFLETSPTLRYVWDGHSGQYRGESGQQSTQVPMCFSQHFLAFGQQTTVKGGHLHGMSGTQTAPSLR